MRSVNGIVACSPFPPRKEKRGGLDFGLDAEGELVALAVLVDFAGQSGGIGRISKGSIVYVRAAAAAAPWARQIFRLSTGEKFVAVPVADIFLVEDPSTQVGGDVVSLPRNAPSDNCLVGPHPGTLGL